MNVLSVNVGLPRDVVWRGGVVRTSIWKSPVEGRVRVIGNNLEGDRQSDLTVHGGPMKAVYVYPSEHYAYWRAELGDDNLPYGAFGENLTTSGILESDAEEGATFRTGSAIFVITRPRTPCYKLAIRFGRDDMLKMFHRSGRTGFYLAVAQEGDVGAGDSIEIGR